MELVKMVYQATQSLPKYELYVLSSQMRRSAISIPSNIAEGYKRRNRREYIQFLSIANASAAELETQVIISREIYPTVDLSQADRLVEEVQKMLYAIILKLQDTSRLHPIPSTLYPSQYAQKTD